MIFQMNFAEVFPQFVIIFLKRKWSNYKINMNIFNIWTTLIIISMLTMLLIILKLRKRPKKRHNVLSGRRPIAEIKTTDEIIKEIHYLSCYCSKNPLLIQRCISLLKMLPEACNVAVPHHNYTPFLRACWNGCSDLILYMVNNGANVHARTDAGEGGIYLATHAIIHRNGKSVLALKILLAAGLDINLARHDGFTALHLAASRGRSTLVGWLLANGANPTPDGVPSAYQIALSYGYPKVAAMLELPKQN